jgi:hypothetical protein
MDYNKFLFQDLSGRLGYAKISKLSYKYYIFIKKELTNKDGIREYVELWLKQPVKIITMMDETIVFDEPEYHSIIDEKEKIIKIEGEVKEYNDNFLHQNGIWDGRDYLEDEIDYEPQHKCVCDCVCELDGDENNCVCGFFEEDWVCKCGFEEDKVIKNNELVEFKYNYEGEGIAITDEYIAKIYGNKYLEKDYIRSKINDANTKIRFLRTMDNGNKYYDIKLATQKCRLYKYSNHNQIPYNFVVEDLGKSVKSDYDSHTYIETHNITMVNDKVYGKIESKHTFDYYDDGYDHESYIDKDKCKNICKNLDEVYVPVGNMERMIEKLHEQIIWESI